MFIQLNMSILYLCLFSGFLCLVSLQQPLSLSPYTFFITLFLFLINLFILFIYFWLHLIFVVHGLSLVVASWGILFIVVHGFLIAGVSLVVEHGLQACRLQKSWLAGSTVQAQQLCRTGLVAPQHVRSSRTRARTCVPCVDRQILNHCATRQAPTLFLINNIYLVIFKL